MPREVGTAARRTPEDLSAIIKIARILVLDKCYRERVCVQEVEIIVWERDISRKEARYIGENFAMSCSLLPRTSLRILPVARAARFVLVLVLLLLLLLLIIIIVVVVGTIAYVQAV